jgi:hypothetical protein
MRVFIKWRLILTTIPFVVGIVGLAVLRDHVFHLRPFLEFADIAPILTASAFLIGFMLSGVMSDYKESEKLPGDIAIALESIEDTLTVASNAHKGLRGDALRAAHRALAFAVADWLVGKKTVDDCYAALKGFLPNVETMDKVSGPLAARVLGDVALLRRAVVRVDVIARTTFLQSGFAVLESMVAIVVILMLVSGYRSPHAEYMVIVGISLVDIYMIRLIRDVDDPFRFGPHGPHRGAAEVDLFPVVEYVERLRRQAVEGAEDGSGSESAAATA